MLKIACLWSIWTHWCKYFYEHQLQDEVFVFNIVSEALHQLILRANETGPVTQWLNIVKERRTDENTRTGEKEFLLCKATSIKKFQEFLNLSEDSFKDPVLKWNGNATFFKISTINYKTKLYINYKEIKRFISHNCSSAFNDDHWLNRQDGSYLTHPAVQSTGMSGPSSSSSPDSQV